MNTLYYGDDLKVLREYIKDESGLETDLQKHAFEGRWHLNKCNPRLQIATVEDFLAGKEAQLPPNLETIKQTERVDVGPCCRGLFGLGGEAE